MENCVFCKIIKGEIDSAKIWEDDEFLAILDIAPIIEGMTMVLPKKHYSSRIFEMPEEPYKNFALAAKKVANLLKEKFNAKRIFAIVEGLDINHAHIKLYPIKKERSLGQLLNENRKTTPDVFHRPTPGVSLDASSVNSSTPGVKEKQHRALNNS